MLRIRPGARIGLLILPFACVSGPLARPAATPQAGGNKASGSGSLSKADEALLRRVDDHYNHLASLRTHYVEHYGGMGMDRTESGTLLLKKPGRMRWTYDRPAGKVFVFDGKFAWFYTPGDPQVQRIPAREMDDLHTPLRFLLGHTQLKKELTGLTVQADGDGFRISGAPRIPGARLGRLTLRTTGDGMIVAMDTTEADGAVTSFVFSEMAENVPATDADFRFVVPDGVTVVSGAPPI